MGAKVYRVNRRQGFVLIDDKGRARHDLEFITDVHPAFKGQMHKLLPAEPGAKIMSSNLLGRIEDITGVELSVTVPGITISPAPSVMELLGR